MTYVKIFEMPIRTVSGKFGTIDGYNPSSKDETFSGSIDIEAVDTGCSWNIKGESVIGPSPHDLDMDNIITASSVREILDLFNHLRNS
ncbi:hypothetical protein [Frateuria aurantia]|uniref:hypothetical protein n=1 Tax=Frateuria aurantia TaxID=81475 RepID=UPI00059DF1FC|nr:hypothetical protein [Frateuria aurantia]